MQMEIASKISRNKASWNENTYKACHVSWMTRLINHISPDEETSCPICFEDIQSNTEKTQCKTQCKKWFHLACMQVWNQKSKTCPLCRSDFVAETEEAKQI